MKQTVVALTLAAALVLMSGCKSEKRQVEQTARGYIEALSAYDVDAAEPYASKHTRVSVLPVTRALIKLTDTNYIKANQPAKISIRKTRIGDSTACVHYHKHTPVQETDDSVKLILEEGKWLVDVHITIPNFDNDSIKMIHRPRVAIKGKK